MHILVQHIMNIELECKSKTIRNFSSFNQGWSLYDSRNIIGKEDFESCVSQPKFHYSKGLAKRISNSHCYLKA